MLVTCYLTTKYMLFFSHYTGIIGFFSDKIIERRVRFLYIRYPLVKKRRLLAIFTFILPSLAFAQDFDNSAGAMIREKNLESLSSFLREYAEDELSELESYIIDSAKNYVIQGDYVYAQALAGVVLRHNLENVDAQELYTSLESSIQQQRKTEEENRRKEEAEKQREEEEQNQREAELRQAEEERQRQEAARAQEERLQREEQERIEEITIVDIGNFSFSFNAALVNLLLYHSDFYDKYYDSVKINLKYGLGIDAAAYFQHPYVKAGLDVAFDTAFVDLLEPSGTPFSYSVLLSGTSPLIQFPFYLTTGFSHLLYSFDPDKTIMDVQTISIPSPVLGFRVGNVHYTNGAFGVDFTGLYYLTALRRNSDEKDSLSFLEYDAVFDTSLRFLFNFYTREGVHWNSSVRLAANFIFVDGQLELNSKILLNIGAVIYAK